MERMNARIKKLTVVADRLTAIMSHNLQGLFTKPKYNRQLLANKLENLNHIYEKFYYQNLARFFHRLHRNKNKWFLKAAQRLALNSRLDLQQSLWRLYDHADLKRETSDHRGRMHTKD